MGVSTDMASSAKSAALGAAANALGNKGDSSGSTTKSDIAEGTVVIRNGDESALNGLERSATELQQSGLKAIYDKKKVADQMEMVQIAGEVGFRTAGAVGELLTKKYHDAELTVTAATATLANMEKEGASEEEKAPYRALVSSSQATMAEYQEQYDIWKDGGTGKTLLHALTGAIVSLSLIHI